MNTAQRIAEKQKEMDLSIKMLEGKNSLGYQFQPFGRVGLNGKPGSLVAEMVKELTAARDASDADFTEAAKLEHAALRGDPEARVALNGARITRVSNFLFSRPKFSSLFCENVQLGLTENPVIQFSTKGEVNVAYIGDNGRLDVKQFTNDEYVGDTTVVPWTILSTEPVESRLYDLNLGNIADSAAATYDIARDMETKVAQTAKLLLTTGVRGWGPAYGAFTLTGVARRLKTWVAHSAVNTDNLPTTNAFTGTLTSPSAANVKTLLDSLIKYGDQWDDTWGMPLVPTGEILVPSSQTTYFLTPISLNQQVGAVGEGILSKYTRFSYGGKDWTIIPDATLAPNTFYVRTSLPVGTIYTKPGSAVNEDITVVDKRANRQFRHQQQQICFALPEPHKVRAMRVVLS
jgi:hypothetical protein